MANGIDVCSEFLTPFRGRGYRPRRRRKDLPPCPLTISFPVRFDPYRIFSVTSVMAASSSEMIQKRVTIFVSKMPFFW